jgi:hypothetical protein
MGYADAPATCTRRSALVLRRGIVVASPARVKSGAEEPGHVHFDNEFINKYNMTPIGPTRGRAFGEAASGERR